MAELGVVKTIGFSGSQHGMTDKQKSSVQAMLDQWARMGYTRARQGCCIGSDEDFTYIATSMTPPYFVIGHPPKNRSKVSWKALDLCSAFWEDEEYLVRNKNIVAFSTIMLFTPHTDHELVRSGTWQAIRYTRNTNRRGIIVWPDGTTDILALLGHDKTIRQVKR
jgi:hypothetical protein